MTLTGTPLLARDATGAYVVQLQRLLSVTPVTGFFGPITEAALTAFQKAHGLPVTATTTPATWSAAAWRRGREPAAGTRRRRPSRRGAPSRRRCATASARVTR